MKRRTRALRRGHVSLCAPPSPPPRELTQWERQWLEVYADLARVAADWADRTLEAAALIPQTFAASFGAAVRQDYARAGEPLGPDDAAMWRWFRQQLAAIGGRA